MYTHYYVVDRVHKKKKKNTRMLQLSFMYLFAVYILYVVYQCSSCVHQCLVQSVDEMGDLT